MSEFAKSLGSLEACATTCVLGREHLEKIYLKEKKIADKIY